MRTDRDRVANRQVWDRGERCRHRCCGLADRNDVQRAARENVGGLAILERARDDTTRTHGVDAGANDVD